MPFARFFGVHNMAGLKRVYLRNLDVRNAFRRVEKARGADVF